MKKQIKFETSDSIIAAAAKHLIETLDDVVPEWRKDTLNQGEEGDEVNAAWDALISKISLTVC